MKRLITEVLSDSDSGSNSDSNCGDESNHEAELFDDEFFLKIGWMTKDFKAYFQSWPLSEILIIINLRYVASRMWTYAAPDK